MPTANSWGGQTEVRF
jgi:hypothetical protein